MDPQPRLHRELIGLLRQHSYCVDQRHLVLLGWMVAGLLLSQTVCFDRWKAVLPLGHCRRWLSNSRVEVEPLYELSILWALQHWQNPGQTLHLALDTTMLWNRYCAVILSVVAHDRAIPLLWTTLEHPSASVSAELVIALLERAEQLGRFEGRPRWDYVIRLRADTWIRGTAAPMGYEVRRLRLPRCSATIR